MTATFPGPGRTRSPWAFGSRTKSLEPAPLASRIPGPGAAPSAPWALPLVATAATIGILALGACVMSRPAGADDVSGPDLRPARAIATAAPPKTTAGAARPAPAAP